MPAGTELVWTYVVTNTGDTPLMNVSATDDQGVVVTCPATQLLVGESMTCEGEPGEAILGEYANIGSVEATPAQPPADPDDPNEELTPVIDPETDEPTAPINDDDESHNFGSEVV